MPTDGALAVPSPLGLELVELARAVSSARERVAGFLAGSESVFLETGEALEQLRNQALSLVGIASKVVDGARPRDSDPVDGLAQGCRRIDLHLAASRRSLDAKAERLRGVLAAIDRLGTFRHLFRRAASALRMLGMSTSIENARAGMESTGFGTVASDVRRLGGLVETKLDGVLDEALSMKRTAGDALVRVADLTRRQGERASSMLDDAAAGLASLRALAQAAAAVGATTSDVSNRVVGSVNSVVISLQIHDITRQMMEHTLEGLQEIEGDLAPLLRAAAPDAAAEEIDAGEMVELGRLQGSQLQQARSKLEEALLALESAPSESELVDRIFRAIHTVKGSSGMFGRDAISSFAHEMEAAFEHVRSGRLAVTKPLIDLSLTATDLIRTMLAAPSEPVPPERERIVAGFRALAPGAPAAPAKATAAPAKAEAATACPARR